MGGAMRGVAEFRLDAKGSAELALSLTRKSAEFFKQYAGKFADTLGKQILLGFATQEDAHCDPIRQQTEPGLTASAV